jgi:hypothetical protein
MSVIIGPGQALKEREDANNVIGVSMREMDVQLATSLESPSSLKSLQCTKTEIEYEGYLSVYDARARLPPSGIYSAGTRSEH